MAEAPALAPVEPTEAAADAPEAADGPAADTSATEAVPEAGKLPDWTPPESVGDEEEALYSQRAKLYRFQDGEWKLSGTGDAKLLRNTKDKKVRFTLKEDETLKANHYVINRPPYCDLQPNAGKVDGKTWVWAAQDYAGEDKSVIEQFALKFGSSEKAMAFKSAFNEAKEQNAIVIKIEGDEEQNEAHCVPEQVTLESKDDSKPSVAAEAPPSSSLGLSASPERTSQTSSPSPFAGISLFGSDTAPTSTSPGSSGSIFGVQSSTGTSSDLFKGSAGLFSSSSSSLFESASGISSGSIFGLSSAGTTSDGGGFFLFCSARQWRWPFLRGLVLRSSVRRSQRHIQSRPGSRGRGGVCTRG
jgi:hypothetical protein